MNDKDLKLTDVKTPYTLGRTSYVDVLESVYYQSTKRELNRILLRECRCDERLKVQGEGSTWSHIHWVTRGTGTPKDRDEVNKREVCECDGCVCDQDTTGAPSIFKIIRNAEALARMLPTFVGVGVTEGTKIFLIL